MAYTCDPCECPEQYYRDSMSWRKAMLVLLCRIKAALITVGESTLPPD
jgi:hypothetical protein